MKFYDFFLIFFFALVLEGVKIAGFCLKRRLHTTHLIFGIVKDADNICYCTKNQACGLCVGGDKAISFLVRFMIK